jgi:hypothetical protein
MVRDGPLFIFAKNMRERPNTPEEIDKKKSDVIHIVLTGWKGNYKVKHPRYFRLPYSSHSSPTELEEFVKKLNPGQLIFNLCNNPAPDRADFETRLVSRYTKEGQKAL